MRNRRLIKARSRKIFSGLFCVVLAVSSAVPMEMQALASEAQIQEVDESTEDTWEEYLESTVETQITGETDELSETETFSTTQTQSMEENEDIFDEEDVENAESVESLEDLEDKESEHAIENVNVEESEELEKETESEAVETSECDVDVSDDSGTYGNINWRIFRFTSSTSSTGFVDELHIYVQEDSSSNPNFQYQVPWQSYKNSITKVSVEGKGSLVNTSYMLSGLTKVESVDLTEFKTDILENTSHMFDGCVNLKTITMNKLGDLDGVNKLSGPNVKDMSYMFQNCRSLAYVDFKLSDTSSVENMSNMFAGCSELRGVAFNENMANVTNMSKIFAGCQNLKKIDLSQFDTSNVEDMSYMFGTHLFEGSYWNCGLESITFGGNTANVTNMSCMFYGCRSLKTIDLRKLDSSNVTDISGMFSGCYNLKEIVFGGDFCTDNVTNMSGMFSLCESFQNLPDFTDLNTSNVTNMSGMFSGCTGLKNPDFTSLNTSNVTNMSKMFAGCRLNGWTFKGLDTSKVENMSYIFSQCLDEYLDLDMSVLDTSKVTDISNMFFKSQNLKTVKLNFDTQSITNMLQMFVFCYELEEVTFGDNFKADHVITMENMFGVCRKLKTLNWNAFEGNSVTNVSHMFNSCESLQTVNLNTFKGNSVTDISWMFSNCFSLETLNLDAFEGTCVENMESMFSGCRSLKTLDLSSFITDNVKTMQGLFSGCRNLASIDLSGFNTSNVINMGGMFNNCSSLTSIDFSNFNTSNVTNMAGIVFGCSSLTSVDFSSFDTSNVTNMSSLLGGCSSLTSVDLSNFDTSNVTDMSYLLSACSSLISVDLSSFDTSNVTKMSGIVYGCSSLKELDLRNFNLARAKLSKYDVSFLSGCNELSVIHTPYNLYIDQNLPKKNENDQWYRSGMGDDAVVQKLPKNLDHSILLMKNKRFEYPYITAQKTKTEYACGETLNLDDLTVSYYDAHGEQTTLTDKQYTTNADELDLNQTGEKLLIVRYEHTVGEKPLETSVELTFTEKTVVEISGVTIEDTIYKAERVSYQGKAVITDQTIGEPINIPLVYTYKGELMDGTPYEENEKPPIDAGHYTLIMAVAQDNAHYTGSCELDFTISKAPVIITADNVMVIKNHEPPQNPKYTYRVKGLFKEDQLIKEPSLDVEADFSKAGIYPITPSGADAGQNYEISYVAGTLTVSDKKPVKITGIEIDGMTYCALPISYKGKAVVKLIDDNGDATQEDVTEQVGKLLYTYRGTLADGTLYNETSNAPKDAGYYTLAIAVAQDNALYTGSCELDFTISKAPVIITVDDIVVMQNHEPPQNVKYTYNVEGLFKEDQLIKEPSFGVEADFSKAGIYPITPSGADAGQNYEISYVAGTLTVSDKKPVKITGIEIDSMTYCALPISYKGKAVVKLTDTNGDITQEVVTENVGALLYTYQGTLADGTLYAETSDAPLDAGSYTLKVKVSDNNELYIGTTEYPFEIRKAPVTIMVENKTINMKDDLPKIFSYNTEGFFGDDKLIKEPSFQCDADISKEGSYEIIPYGAEAGMNYEIFYENGLLIVNKDGELIVEMIPHQVYTGKAIKPNVRVFFDHKVLLTPGKDYTVKYYNNINADTDEESQRKSEISRDGTTSDGFTKEMAYVVIKGKGNYAGTVYRNFYIDPVKISEDGINEADGVVLKYKDQLVINKKKSQKVFQSIKCKKSMKLNNDFVVNLTAKKAYSNDGKELPTGQPFLNKNVPVIPVGSYGTFELKIEGINNYRGILTKTVYVTEKAYLMKNAKIKFGKNLKSVTFVNGGVRLTPAYYDESGAIQYVTSAGTFKEVSSLDDAFTVFIGKECLKYGDDDADKDYTISYKNNDKVGTATLIIEGKGRYMGTKCVNFKVIGAPFTTKTVSFNKFRDTMTYTGEECRQDDIELTDTNGNVINPACYTVSYENNVKKGTASMTVTANPKLGYIGKVKKSYKIMAADIATAATVVPVDELRDKIESKGNGVYHLDGMVIFKKSGATPTNRISLLLNANQERPITLVENKDYSVKFTDNMSTKPGATPTMTITGKGNLTGTLMVTFNISKTPLQSAENLFVNITAVPFKEKNQESFQYQPKIKITDGKKALKEGTDYTISEYVNCSQKDVKAYLNAKKGDVSEDGLQRLKPYVVITAGEGSDYSGSMNVDLSIYDTKITASTLYVVILDDANHSQTTYTGAQIRPEVEVYYGAAKAVKEAKKENVTDSAILTKESGKYKLTKLELKQQDNSGDYTLEYDANIKAGKNAGSVSVIGIGKYGGKVKTKFTIQGDDVFDYQVEPWLLFADKMKLIFVQ